MCSTPPTQPDRFEIDADAVYLISLALGQHKHSPKISFYTKNNQICMSVCDRVARLIQSNASHKLAKEQLSELVRVTLIMNVIQRSMDIDSTFPVCPMVFIIVENLVNKSFGSDYNFLRNIKQIVNGKQYKRVINHMSEVKKVLMFYRETFNQIKKKHPNKRGPLKERSALELIEEEIDALSEGEGLAAERMFSLEGRPTQNDICNDIKTRNMQKAQLSKMKDDKVIESLRETKKLMQKETVVVSSKENEGIKCDHCEHEFVLEKQNRVKVQCVNKCVKWFHENEFMTIVDQQPISSISCGSTGCDGPIALVRLFQAGCVSKRDSMILYQQSNNNKSLDEKKNESDEEEEEDKEQATNDTSPPLKPVSDSIIETFSNIHHVSTNSMHWLSDMDALKHVNNSDVKVYSNSSFNFDIDDGAKQKKKKNKNKNKKKKQAKKNKKKNSNSISMDIEEFNQADF